MTATLASLLAAPGFGLTVLTGAPDPRVLEATLAWAHASDLEDPTPWLEPGGLLLTDGVGFLEDAGAADVDAYVARLAAAGVRALGFAEGVAHDAVPEGLVAACERQSFPLIEVPAATPFMGIIRHVADAIAGEQRARLEWSLAAQRAVALAALRPDGLTAILDELERRLGTWVALFDRTSEPIRVSSRTPIPDADRAAVTDAARALLARRTMASVRLDRAGGTATLQTIGHGGHMRGVLAVGTGAPLDAAGNDLVSSVIALASIALEQSSTLETARRRLRAGILELLSAGVLDVAGSTAAVLWGRLPSPPFRVLVTELPHPDDSLIEELEVAADRVGGRLFFADHGARLALLVHAEEESLAGPFFDRHGLRVGVSGPVARTEVRRGLTEAARALGHTAPARPRVRFDDLAAMGMLTFLETAGGTGVAERLLEPLRGDAKGAELLRVAAVWLRHLGQWDPAARELGIHRQTLRARIDAVGDALALDLDSVEGRTELWAAMTLTGIVPTD